MPVRQKQKRTQGIDIHEAHRRDSFQTPNYATELLIPFLPKYGFVWEPACGEGKISNVLRKKGYGVLSSDILPKNENRDQQFNFLLDKPKGDFIKSVSMIITNPPFSLKKLFYDKCIEYVVPFAILIPTDYCGWIIDGLQHGAEKIIPTRRIDYITPSGLSGESGHSANFHSMWLTKGFGLGRTETFVELTREMKENI